jgi:hypothetical protein
MSNLTDDSFINDADLEEFSVPLFLKTADLQTQTQAHFTEFENGWEGDLFTGKEHLLYALDDFYDEFIPSYYLGEDFTESKQTRLKESELEQIFSERVWTSLSEFKVLFFDFLVRLSEKLPTEDDEIKEFYSKLQENNYSISYEKFERFCKEGLPSDVTEEYEKYEDSLQDCLLPVSIDEGTVWEGPIEAEEDDRTVKVEVIDFGTAFDKNIRAHMHPYPIVRVLESSNPKYKEDETYEFPIPFFKKSTTTRTV